jgi:hypothetical protein
MTTLSVPLGATPGLEQAAQANQAAAPQSLQVGYGVSLTDLSAFNQSLAGAAGRLEARAITAPSASMQALFRPLEQINGEASALSAHAKSAVEAGNSLTPGEMVMLSVKCHEFLFHSQLTANIANRTSDGLQQLFRQQA